VNPRVNQSGSCDLELEAENILRWREMWSLSAPVHGDLVRNPTVEPPGFDLRRREWVLLNRFRASQRKCATNCTEHYLSLIFRKINGFVHKSVDFTILVVNFIILYC
jgi:hypothetical protein